MHLSEFMESRKLSDETVAKGIKRSRVTVSRIRRRRVRPNWPTIQEIYIYSGGLVTADDFVELNETAR
jgi:hypothetical protein